MLKMLFQLNHTQSLLGAIAFSYIFTCLFLVIVSRFLPKDKGRDFALNGKISRGKPRGAGAIFITVFVLASILFLDLGREYLYYVLVIFLSMLTGFFDDASPKPWGEYLKGIFDLIISIMIVVIYSYYNVSAITIQLVTLNITLNKYLFYILAIILIWGSINVTNCSDGVDGMVGTVSIVTLLSFLFLDKSDSPYRAIILIMIMCILGYMWFNVSPSKLIMGDAGSRAIGVFIAVLALKSLSPLLFIPFSAVFIIDGGLGLLKIALLRIFKIRILKNIRTPIHDHVRKTMKWSDSQTVMRFAIIQLLISMTVFGLINLWID